MSGEGRRPGRSTDGSKSRATGSSRWRRWTRPVRHRYLDAADAWGVGPARVAATGVLLVVALVVLAAYAGWLLWSTQRNLGAALDDVGRLQDAVESGDTAGQQRLLDDLADHTGTARSRTDSWVWHVVGLLPVVGDDADAVRVAADVVDRVVTEGGTPLVEAVPRLEQLAPRDGRVDLTAVPALRAPVARAEEVLAGADEELGRIDGTGLAGPVAEEVDALHDRVRSLGSALRAADVALRLAPAMLGGESERRYLLVFQNNAEARSTGGLPGAVSELRVRDGRLDLARQVAGNSFAPLEEPVLPLTSEERAVFGDQLGTFFLDAGFTPDFPRAAELWRARWQQAYPGRVDGVLSLDPVAMSYLLRATGPLEVAGVELTGDNAVEELLHRVYLRYEDPADQDVFFRQVSAAFFDRVVDGAGDPAALLRAMARGVGERRIALEATDAAEQAVLAPTTIAGRLPGASTTGRARDPQVGLYVDDATASKMSWYLRYDSQTTATACRDGRQELSGRAYLRSVAPVNAMNLPSYITGGGTGGTAKGEQSVVTRVLGPVGGRITRIALNGEPIDLDQVRTLDGRPVLTAFLGLPPTYVNELTWTMTTGPGQTGDVVTRMTPGVLPRAYAGRAPSAC